MKVKIGDKEYTLNYSNRVIYDIEDHFGESISKFLVRGDDHTKKELGHLIHFGVKDDMTFEEFTDNMKLSQYVQAQLDVVSALSSAFGIDSSKKKGKVT
jgi:hypothetical protein